MYYVLHADCCSVELDVPTLAEAKRLLREWCEGGSWAPEGDRVEAWIEDDEGETVWSGSIDIDPDHEALIEAATLCYEGDMCGTDPDDHEWTAGKEYLTGGTSGECRSYCRRCGLRRVERYTGEQHNPGEANTVEYSMYDD